MTSRKRTRAADRSAAHWSKSEAINHLSCGAGAKNQNPPNISRCNQPRSESPAVKVRSARHEKDEFKWNQCRRECQTRRRDHEVRKASFRLLLLLPLPLPSTIRAGELSEQSLARKARRRSRWWVARLGRWSWWRPAPLHPHEIPKVVRRDWDSDRFLHWHSPRE